MKEQYTTFKTAKLAKEKGFDESSNQIYTFKKELRKSHYHDARNSNAEHGMSCVAVTQSSLQKWILDRHNILIGVIHWDLDHQKFSWFVDFTFSKFKETEIDDDRTEFETFENALEFALQAVLKIL